MLNRTLQLWHKHFLILLIITFVARVATELMASHFTQSDYGWFILRGFSSDAAICGVLAAILAVIRFKWLSFLVYIPWITLLAANLVHIDFNKANISFSDSGQLSEEEFLFGVILTDDVLVPLFLFSMFSYLVAKFARTIDFSSIGTPKRYATFFVLLLLCVAFLPASDNSWRSYNVIEENIVDVMPISSDMASGVTQIRATEEYKRFTGLDLKGKPIIPLEKTRPNILIVTIEGLTDSHLSNGYMPYLSTMARKFLYYPNFIYPQQYTLNGLYSIICGDYPTFNSDSVYRGNNKWFATQNRGAYQPCLPAILKQYGYKSFFFQGSSLAYTNKRRFIRRAGFTKAYQASDLKTNNSKSMKFTFLGWGMADAVFLPKVADKLIDQNVENSPWAAVVMTTGTHPPFNITKPYASQFSNGPHAAFHAADQGIKGLMTNLEKADLLKNTLVIVVGDESRQNRNRESKFTPLAANWGVMVIKTPDNQQYTSREYFMQPDIMTSVFDYLGIQNEAKRFRSVFRKYENFRPLIMASAHSRYWITYFEQGKLLVCKINRTKCRVRAIEGEFFNSTLQPDDSEVNYRLFNEVSKLSDSKINPVNIVDVETVPSSNVYVTYKKVKQGNKIYVRKIVRKPVMKKRKPKITNTQAQSDGLVVKEMPKKTGKQLQ
ncbi:MAG: LTA synthase family protein [Alphaproteobacteria bacterium]